MDLYAESGTESIAKVMLEVDSERMTLMDSLGLKGLSVKNLLGFMYEEDFGSLAKAPMAEQLRKSPIHTGPKASRYPISINSRYLTEDIPYALVPFSSIGHMLNVATPTIDAVIKVSSIMLDVDYFEEGLTVGDIGIEGMSREEVMQAVS